MDPTTNAIPDERRTISPEEVNLDNTSDGNGISSLEIGSTCDSRTTSEQPNTSPLEYGMIAAGTSLIDVPRKKTTTVPKLPTQLPYVEGTCGTNNCYLPPATDAQIILQEYLHDYNSKIPLFSPESLYTLFRDCYAGAADQRPLAWVLLYTTIGMTYRLRAMSIFAAPQDTTQAEWYLSACLGRLPDLLVQPPCIRLVQACISIAWLLETSSRRDRAPFFASMALRMATELGYNDLPTKASTVDELEQRHVFWLAFFIEQHFSFAESRTGPLRVDDINTPLPGRSVSNWWDLEQVEHADSPNLNVFALHCSLAMLEAEAAEKLFSIPARKQSTVELNAVASSMLDKLAVWRQQDPLSHSDPSEIVRSMYRSDIILCIVLEAAYFRAAYQMHTSRALGSWKEKSDVFDVEVLRLGLQLDRGLLLEDALWFLGLATLMPQGNVSTTW